MFLEVRDVAGLMAASAGGQQAARCVGLEVEGETEAGENYGSTFLMLRAHYEEGSRKYTLPAVCKRLPPTQYLREVFNVDVSFPKEVNFYCQVVPMLHALQAELRVPEQERIQVFPQLLGARIGASEERVDDEAIMVLENLCASGYSCGSRFQGLDLAHCKLAVRELARFHALGIVLKRSKPDLFRGAVSKACVHFLHNRPRDKNEQTFREFQENTLNLVLSAIPEVLDIVDEDRLRRAVMIGWEGEPIEEPFASICHTDFWVNNMMFAYDGQGNPDRLKMVDFQMTQIGSPVRDLLFFLYSSADSAALARTDDLIREYHEELVRYVRVHGHDPVDLSWEALQQEIAKVVRLEFSHVFIMITIIRTDKRVEKADSNSVEVFSHQLGISKQARTRYVELVTDWAKRGWL